MQHTPGDHYEVVARFYDAENTHMVDDLALYADLLRETGGPVLDVGCGTGRVALHLAQEGAHVVGLERSAPMLVRARRKLAALPDLRERIALVRGDLADVDLPERFPLIIFSYNGFMHLHTPEVQLRALARLRAWLSPDGLLVIDLPNPGEVYATSDDDSLVLEQTFVEPESGHVVMQQSVSTLDRAAQLMHVTWIYDEILDDGTVRRTLAPVTLRYVFPAEMDLLLRAAGLHRVRRYGDYDGGPFEEGCSRLIVVAKEGEG